MKVEYLFTCAGLAPGDDADFNSRAAGSRGTPHIADRSGSRRSGNSKLIANPNSRIIAPALMCSSCSGSTTIILWSKTGTNAHGSPYR